METEQDKRALLFKQVEEASRLVATWPVWKQNLLRESMKSTCDIPRKRVINGQHDCY